MKVCALKRFDQNTGVVYLYITPQAEVTTSNICTHLLFTTKFCPCQPRIDLEIVFIHGVPLQF